MTGGALAGIRVLDVTLHQAGPSCTQLLAWFGADVIKIEQPGTGDISRWQRRDREDLDSLYYLVLNANKKSLTLNLRHEKGKEIFVSLLKTADILVENFGPGAMERLGFAWPAVHEINPRLIYASIKGFGSWGPYSSYQSLEWVAQATGGAMSLCGWADGPPMVNGVFAGDSGSGVHAAVGILAALQHRHNTGLGQHVDVSMQDAVCNLIRVRFRDHQRLGRPTEREGTGLPGYLGSGLFRCAPGGPNDYIFIQCHAPVLPKLFKAIGRPDLTEELKGVSPQEMRQHVDRINAIIAEWAMQRDKQEAMRLLGEAGVAAGAVLDTGDLLDDQQLREREMIVKLSYPGRGDFFTVGNPIKLSASQVPMSPPPTLGQNTAEVLAELLGLPESEVESLRKEGVV
ncbi:MAG: CoA transferase [Chloroflexi bacterium]|nr:CoA transferase [Chloroflexota bacterium]